MDGRKQDPQLIKTAWGYKGIFQAMASPCELLMATFDPLIVQQMLQLAVEETKRIEQKYSRFITNNPLWKINHAQGDPSTIDAETYALLCFAQQCYQLSDGSFDITACPLMQLWRFDGSKTLPKNEKITQALKLVDFSKVIFDEHRVQMPAGMSLDFGGIAKEYAVDKVANQLTVNWSNISVLVNFGGDIACPIAKLKQQPWTIGIENPLELNNAAALLQIRQGALATSGDTRRFIEKAGKIYGHIINPKTGFPVENAPRSVTVLGPNCITAGMLATMAMLQGENAENFLDEQQVQYKIFR